MKFQAYLCKLNKKLEIDIRTAPPLQELFDNIQLAYRLMNRTVL